jgi:hypothetical protein
VPPPADYRHGRPKGETVSDTVVLLLLLLQVKHFLFDFILQTPYQLKNKGTYGHPGGILHSGLHAVGTGVVLLVVATPPAMLVAIMVGEFLVHYHIDWAKEQITRRSGGAQNAFFWRMIGLDQFLHQLTYVAIAAILYV